MSDRRSLYFDMDGEPIDGMEWGRLFENFAARVIAETKVGNVTVRTTWLGIDDSCGARERPLIFGTAVLSGEGIDERRQYASREEALAGHAEEVASL